MPKTEDTLLRDDFPALAGRIEDNRYISPTLSMDGPPEQIRLPSLADMRDMSKADMLRTLEHYGVVAPWETMQTQAAAYITRMTELRPGTEAFKAELDRITTVEAEGSRGVLSLTRRVTQQWSTLDAIDGDVNKEMMWLTEDDESLCTECAGRGGLIYTYAEWSTLGFPGAAVCLGGDQCRCDLIVVE